jgi:hypothetical protein
LPYRPSKKASAHPILVKKRVRRKIGYDGIFVGFTDGGQ